MIICLFLACCGVTLAQPSAPTTEEEYNYGVVGYKLQLQNRLDTRKGYSLRDAEGCEETDRKIEYKLLYRDGESQPCAVFVVFTRTRSAPLYYCMPSANANPLLWEKFYKSLSAGTDNPAGQLQFFATCFARFGMGLFGQ
jgi:hypothetical protein